MEIAPEKSEDQHEKGNVSNSNIFSRIWANIKGLKPLLLSHHPDCQEFEKHTIKIGKYRFCIGCFVGYPVAVASVILIYFLLNYVEITPPILFWLGVIFMSSIILSPLNFTDYKPIKIIQKILFNIGGGFLFWWTWSFTSSFLFNFLIFFSLFSILLTLVNSYHAYGIYRTCKDCDYNLKWEKCPGFRELFAYCEKNNLPNIFKQVRQNQIKRNSNNQNKKD